MNADAIVAELEARRAQGWSAPSLKELAVRLLHESNPRFHWTGIYELVPDGTLRLGPFRGAPTEHESIAVGRGVCGTAVAEARNINVPDVRELDNYLACSLETRSELVVLIRAGSRIHAQIDIDSHEPAAFDASTEARVQMVADALVPLYEAENPGRGEAAR